jgi:CheY-like chemotaxis protein
MAAPSIVIIEQDRDSLDSLEAKLRSHGLDVRAFDNGRDGLNAIVDEPPALIILAVDLARTGGYQICKKLKLHGRFQKIPIFLTAPIEERDAFEQHKKLKIHAEEYFYKPLNLKKVWEAACAHIPELGPVPDPEDQSRPTRQAPAPTPPPVAAPLHDMRSFFKKEVFDAPTAEVRADAAHLMMAQQLAPPPPQDEEDDPGFDFDLDLSLGSASAHSRSFEAPAPPSRSYAPPQRLHTATQPDLDALRAQLAAHEERAARLQQQQELALQERDEALAALQQALAERDQALLAPQADPDAERALLDQNLALHDENLALRDQLAQLQGALADRDSAQDDEAQALHEALQQSREDQELLQHALHTQRVELEQGRLQYAELQRELANTRGQLDDMGAQMILLESRASQHGEDRDKATHDLEQKLARAVEALQGGREHLRAVIARAEADINELRAQHQRAAEQWEQERALMAEEQRRLSDLVRALEERAERLEAELTQTQSALQQTHGELESLQHEHQGLWDTLQASEADAQRLARDLEDTQQQLSTSLALRHQLTDELGRVEERSRVYLERNLLDQDQLQRVVARQQAQIQTLEDSLLQFERAQQATQRQLGEVWGWGESLEEALGHTQGALEQIGQVLQAAVRAIPAPARPALAALPPLPEVQPLLDELTQQASLDLAPAEGALPDEPSPMLDFEDEEPPQEPLLAFEDQDEADSLEAPAAEILSLLDGDPSHAEPLSLLGAGDLEHEADLEEVVEEAFEDLHAPQEPEEFDIHNDRYDDPIAPAGDDDEEGPPPPPATRDVQGYHQAYIQADEPDDALSDAPAALDLEDDFLADMVQEVVDDLARSQEMELLPSLADDPAGDVMDDDALDLGAPLEEPNAPTWYRQDEVDSQPPADRSFEDLPVMIGDEELDFEDELIGEASEELELDLDS